ALFAMRIDRGPWMIVGVAPQGHDDAGRPGALAFHALFVGPWTYARAGADPFAFAAALRGDWTAADIDAILPPGRVSLRGAMDRDCADPATPAVVDAIQRGRTVIVHSARPIDAMARDVWRALPLRARLRASVATWAFDNANRFDLVAVPKLAGVARDPSDLI